MQIQLIIRLDLIVYSLPVGLAVYFILFFSGFNDAELKAFLIGALPAAIVVTLVLGNLARYFQVVKPANSYLQATSLNEEGRRALKLHLLKSPGKEALNISLRWLIGVATVAGVLTLMTGFRAWIWITNTIVFLACFPISACL